MLILYSNEPIKVAYLQKLADQSMLNGAFVIEMVYISFSEIKLISLVKARTILVV